MIDTFLANPIEVFNDLVCINPRDFINPLLEFIVTIIIAFNISLIKRFNIHNKNIIRIFYVIALFLKLLWGLIIINKLNTLWYLSLLILYLFLFFEIFQVKLKSFRLLLLFYLLYQVIVGFSYLTIDYLNVPDSYYKIFPNKVTLITNRYYKNCYNNFKWINLNTHYYLEKKNNIIIK